VIPTFNTMDHVRAAVESVRRFGSDTVEIVVVDDASSDDTVTVLRRDHPSVLIVSNPRNLGFTASANRGMARATGEIVVLLNSDAELLSGSLEAVVGAFSDIRDLAVAGAELTYPDGSPQWSGGRFPSAAWLFALTSGCAVQAARIPGYRRIKRPGAGRTGRVDWVTGAALAVRRSTWNELGPFDERYRFYAQDMDFCRRVTDRGLQVRIIPGFRALHHHGATIGAARGSTDSANPELLWTDLLRFVALHDGARSFRRCRHLMVLGARLRIIARRLRIAGMRGARRQQFEDRTELYRKAAAAVRTTTPGVVIASA